MAVGTCVLLFVPLCLVFIAIRLNFLREPITKKETL